MYTQDSILMTYEEVLNYIENKENHLLLGNGFNRGLGVNTSYQAIFEKMIELNPGLYNEAQSKVCDNDYDLEKFIGCLEEDIKKDNKFLKNYVPNKVKFDFMKATHHIVKSEIKNIYTDNTKGIFILLKNFDNFFTLNYDSFLYLLLLHYKKPNKKLNLLVFQPSILFIEEDINAKQNEMYKEIKDARQTGKLELTLNNSTIKRDFRKLTQSHFTTEIKEFSKAKSKNWKGKDIEQVVKIILEEEKKNLCLAKVDDGSIQETLFSDEYIFDNESTTKNLFFLHGAFHIYKDGELEKKITKSADKALYDRLESILNNEEQEIICIFQSDNKLDAINKSDYLKSNLQKLQELSGNMVIIGSSLSTNDRHIFDRINSSNIETLFISTIPEKKDEIFKSALTYFPEKSINLFDATSISYKLTEEDEETTNE